VGENGECVVWLAFLAPTRMQLGDRSIADGVCCGLSFRYQLKRVGGGSGSYDEARSREQAGSESLVPV